jgi:hypothetical protein
MIRSFFSHIFLFFIFLSPLTSQWSTDPAVNSAISIATSTQFDPKIVSDGSGGAIITWKDYRSLSNYDIYAQRINSSGVVQWTANGVAISTETSHQQSPTIVSDGSGGVIIAWEDFRGGEWDIYAQKINSSGVVQWTADGVAISTVGSHQRNPTIASDNSGGAIITWNDSRSGMNYDVYAQRINSSGVVQWTANGVAISTASDDQSTPTIISDGSGGAIITWRDYRNGSTNSDIYAQKINSSGVVQWTANGVAISTAIYNQHTPIIVSGDSGGAIITWEDYRSGTYYDIYAQKINASGVVQWDTNSVAISTVDDDQLKPSIVSDGSGGAIITWYDHRTGSEYDIYAQKVNASGAVQWTADGIVISTAISNQINPTIISDGSGGAIITWQDVRNGANNDIYAQKINASGSLQWIADGVAISTAADDQSAPTIVSNGSGGAIVTWHDQRDGVSYDIYAQYISGVGTLPVEEVEVGSVPLQFSLKQNYPNPFNPVTTIHYQLPVNSQVTLKVFDVLGREVATLVNEDKKAGSYEVEIDGSKFTSGMYFYRLQTGNFVEIKKLLLIK